MKKEFIKLAGILCAITLVAALLLACVNKITAPEIEKAEKQASVDAMETLIPEADEFVAKTENVNVAMSGDRVIGYCVTVETKGFGGVIKMMVGLDAKGDVRGIDVLSHSETAGLGAKADTDDFKQRFSNVNVEKVGEVQAITGATITSNAVKEGVKMAFEEVKKLEGGDK